MDLNDGDRDEYRPTIVGKAVKIILWSCVILTYGIIMVRLFMSCEPDLSDKVILDKKASELYESQKSMFIVWQYEPSYSIDKESGIWIRNIRYLSTASQIQFTVRVNTNQYDYMEGSTPFYYVLKLKTPVDESKAQDTDEYEVTYVKDEKNEDIQIKVVKKVQTLTDYYGRDDQKFNYGYNRVSFRNAALDEYTEAVLYIYDDEAHTNFKHSITICGPDISKNKLKTAL